MAGAKHQGGVPDPQSLIELKTAKLPQEHSRWTLERHKVCLKSDSEYSEGTVPRCLLGGYSLSWQGCLV